MTVTFCGHSDIYYDKIIEEQLSVTVEKFINDGADTFLLGGYGNFDKLAAKVVDQLKTIYPHIESILVIPYLDRKYDLKMYDYTIYPPLETVPLKFAISKRNEWMIDNSDCLIACVKYGWGGAAKTLAYAKRKKKNIVEIK